jgi:uncharacterized protein (DUF305 family)
MTSTIRGGARALTLAGVLAASLMTATVTTTTAQTPAATSCAGIGTPAASGMMAGMATPGGMDHSAIGHGEATPGAMMGQVEFDQMYIDMMIPHHESIMALAQVALPELEDPRLKEIAQAIIDTQGPEIEHLQQLRTEWYGSADTMPMTDASMAMMLEAMPVGTVDEMMMQMSAEAQVQAFCAAPDKDLAFIDQVIPHHQMAIDSSAIAVEQAVHPELKAIAEDVIAAQQAEIDELQAIRAELTGAATPAS